MSLFQMFITVAGWELGKYFGAHVDEWTAWVYRSRSKK